MELKFRIATEKDLSGIIKLCNMVFEENSSLEYAIKIWNQTKNDPNQIYIVGILAGKVIAHAKITIIPTIYEKMNTYALLNHVCVNPQYRRHNIATKMLDFVHEVCAQRNCKEIKLWSKNFRVAAHACYKKYGFELEETGFFLMPVTKKEKRSR